MSILPRNKFFLEDEYSKSKKDINFETQSMLDNELFFKMKEEEYLREIEKQSVLDENDEIVDDDIVNDTSIEKKRIA